MVDPNSQRYLVQLCRDAHNNTKNSTQFTKALALVNDKERLEEARKQLLVRASVATEDGRIKRYIAVMNARKLPPFPITREKAIDYFTALVGDEEKSFYSSAGDYVVSTVSRLKCIDGAFDMNKEDEAALRAVIGRQRRIGKFEHEQAPGILIDEIKEVRVFNKDFAAAVAVGFLFGLRRRTLLHHVQFGGACDLTDNDVEVSIDTVEGYNSEDEEEGGADIPAAVYEVADEKKNDFQPFAGDFLYNPRSKVFMLDLRPYILKSNAIKQVFVNCLCSTEGLGELCPHVCVPAVARDKKWKLQLIDHLAEFFGHKRTHCMRVGCLQHLMGCNITKERISCHLRWQSDSMQKFYNRSNKYKHNTFKGYSFIP
eukprot:g19064.t1